MSVDYSLTGDVAVVTLSRADRFNAVEATLSHGVVEAVGRAGDEARALVLTGAGRAFCAGADLTELIADYEARGPNLGDILERIFHPMVAALVDAPIPTVAAVNGVAAGAGLGLALACDIRIAASSATFVSAFTGIGLVPDSGSTWGLAATIGVGRALEMALTNRRLDAGEAVAWGLCAETVPDEELTDRALTVAASLADLVPDALVTTRRLIREAVVTPFSQALAAEREQQDRLGRSPAHMEGVRAFVEKRKPDYRGV
ncbi:MAG TPA: enoyl-CoA hydratase-related protein [Acidimicrobiia bacterium]